MVSEEVVCYPIEHFIRLSFSYTHGRNPVSKAVLSFWLPLAHVGVEVTAAWASILRVSRHVLVPSPHAAYKMKFDCGAFLPKRLSHFICNNDCTMPSRLATHIRFHLSASALTSAGELLKVFALFRVYAFAKLTEAGTHGNAKP